MTELNKSERRFLSPWLNPSCGKVAYIVKSDETSISIFYEADADTPKGHSVTLSLPTVFGGWAEIDPKCRFRHLAIGRYYLMEDLGL